MLAKSFTASASVSPMNRVSMSCLMAPSFSSSAKVRAAWSSRSSPFGLPTMMRLG
ncbi:Uncharacterised protein [Segatella copri]|nr:Uncharacterised protein [Segatella copri]